MRLKNCNLGHSLHVSVAAKSYIATPVKRLGESACKNRYAETRWIPWSLEMFMQILDKLVSSPILLIGTFLAVSFMVGGLRHWLLDHSLRDRQQFSDEEFGKTFFPGSKRSADVAVRVREILSENLEMPLDGIRPEDRLDEELNVQLEANPHLFWSLEEEYGFDAMVEDLEEFQKTVAGIVTFSDLVNYVEGKVDQEPKKGRKKKSEHEIDPDDRTGDFIAAMWFGGLITTIVAEILGFRWLRNLGLTIAFLPLGIGGLYMCCKMIGEVISIARNEGLKVLLGHPFSSLYTLAMFTTFLLVGVWFTGGIIEIWFSEK